MGPGGEKIDNLGELTVKVRTKQHGGSDISSGCTFQGAKVGKPLLAVSGILWSSMKRIHHPARLVCQCGICEKVRHRSSRRHSTTCEK